MRFVRFVREQSHLAAGSRSSGMSWVCWTIRPIVQSYLMVQKGDNQNQLSLVELEHDAYCAQPSANAGRKRVPSVIGVDVSS